MSTVSGSLEDAVKQRSRDSKMRREEVNDPQPEGKRLKLGNEEGSTEKEGTGKEEQEGVPCLDREESGIQTEGGGQTVS